MNDSSEFLRKYGPWALVAGGSEGIGRSFAEQLAGVGFNLILLARNQGPLDEAADAIRAGFPVEVVAASFDLTAPDLEQRLSALIEGRDIGLMIYNAGAANSSHPFLDQSLDYLGRLVRLNCDGPLVFAHVLGNRLRVRGGGGMIFLSSMAAFFGTAYVTAYAATKSFDIILAEGLWAELRSANIDVLSLVAGATDTPAMYRIDPGFKANTDTAAASTTVMRPPLMSSDEVAREGLEFLGKGPMRIAGEGNRNIAAAFAQAPRESMIELMSGASAALFDKPWPEVYSR